MKPLCVLALLLAGLFSAFGQTEETRTWTDAKGNAINGVYLNSTEDSVTIKRMPDGQVFRLLLAQCKPDEQAYVAEKKKAAREAESLDATVQGEVTWRLPAWNNLSWSTKQPAELWIWDDKTRAPLEKVADLSVEYRNSSKRNEFFGSYKSEKPVRLWKPAKYVIKASFRGTVNGENKSVEQTSTPMVLPSLSKGAIDFAVVRFSLTR